MLYVPIRIYPTQKSVQSCLFWAAIFLGMASVALVHVPSQQMRAGVVLLCLIGLAINAVKAISAMRRQPMLKVLDDRFSVYTPFGYAMVRFGEVLAFRKGGLPGMRTLRVEINHSTQAKFPSPMSKLLYSLAWLRFSNSVHIPAVMLGANLDPVMKMLEKRRLAAVRLEAIDNYNPSALTTPV